MAMLGVLIVKGQRAFKTRLPKALLTAREALLVWERPVINEMKRRLSGPSPGEA